ncbi:MAG: hypothetical protein JO322_14145 [Candidatus Eremiobacteraeota bacterium]|nr:hypothetical protein [Candidatus Eremiobacteraeota bacterium]
MFSRTLRIGAIFGCALAATVSFSHAASSKPAFMTALVGTWNCTYDGPKGHQSSTLTFSAMNDTWLKETEKDGAYGKDPAHEGFGYITYDTKKHQYIDMGGTTLANDYGVSSADASPSATSITFVGAFPADPSHGRNLITLNGNTVTTHSSWTQKGKQLSGHGSCTKQ